MPLKKYDVIIADPPWKFTVWNVEKSPRHASHKYQLMDTDDICNLPVHELTAENSALVLWATWPNLLDAIKVIDAWGFTYRTQAWTWVKAKRTGFGFFTEGYAAGRPDPAAAANHDRCLRRFRPESVRRRAKRRICLVQYRCHATILKVFSKLLLRILIK